MKIIGNTVKTPLNPKKIGDELELENKLDKTSEANKIYGTNATGEQTTFTISNNAGSSTIVQRRGNGQIPLPAQPADASCATSKGYVDTEVAKKVAQTTEGYKIYGTNAKEQAVFDWSYEANANTIPRRLFNGNMVVPLKPTEAKHATSKGYVDELVNPLEKRVSDLESLTLSYPEIASTDYEKIVPAEVGKYALLKSIGGATEKVVSNNLLNPKDILRVEGRGGATVDYPFTIDNDGSISFTVTQESLGANIYFDTSSLGTGKYYVLCELNGDATTNVNATSGGVFGYENEWWIEVAKPEGEMYPDWYPDEFTFNCKLAIYKAEDSDTLEFVDAPEGTVFEPYHEPYFVNAEVEKVESLGKNRLPSDVYDAKNWVNYSGAWWQYPLDFLTDGWYCVSLKLIEGYNKDSYFYLQKSINGNSYTAQEAGYNRNGYLTSGYLLTANGLDNSAFWFKVDRKSKTVYRFVFQALTQSKLNQIYDIQIERVNLTQEPSSSYTPSKNAPATAYTPYQAEPIDSITIPEAVRSKEGYGREGSYIEWLDGVATLIVTKDENLVELAEPIVTDITVPNKLQVEGGGVIRFVNENEMAVPNTVGFVTRKE